MPPCLAFHLVSEVKTRALILLHSLYFTTQAEVQVQISFTGGTKMDTKLVSCKVLHGLDAGPV